MTNLGTWKRTAVAAAAVASVIGVGLGGAALAESHGASVPAQSVRAESRKADLPTVTLPLKVRQESTTYRVTGDECVGTVCAKSVSITTPEADLSSVGGEVETPTVELATGEVKVAATYEEGAVSAAAHYGAIGTSASIRPEPPRH